MIDLGPGLMPFSLASQSGQFLTMTDLDRDTVSASRVPKVIAQAKLVIEGGKSLVELPPELIEKLGDSFRPGRELKVIEDERGVSIQLSFGL